MPAGRPDGRRRRAMKGVVVDSRPMTGKATRRSAGRRANGHLRGQRPRLHRPLVRRDARTRGDVPRLHREDPLPRRSWASPPSSSCRSSQFDAHAAPAGLANAGATSGLLLRPRVATTATRRRAGQVDEFKSSSASSTSPTSRSSSTSSTTTPRGRPLRPDGQLRGLDKTIYYMLERHPALYNDYSGCGNTLNCNHPSSASSSSTASGTGSPRCTSTASASTWRRSSRSTTTAGEGPADHPRDRDRPGAVRDQADRRAVEQPAVPGRHVLRPPLGRVERAVPRRGPPFVKGDAGRSRAARAAAPRQPRPLRPSGASPCPASTS